MKGSLGDFRKNKKEKKQINIKNRNVAKKERSSAAVDEQFLSNLVQLGKIVLHFASNSAERWRRFTSRHGKKLEPLFIRVGGFLRVWNCCIRREFFVEILDEFHHGKLSP